ncbi:hypothetical protein DFH07DRAFT_856963 [Mycena maculata]|uniref:Uncharacterized protein n=1 Tax=Mycena maculata TaxID=230809 RepID=A0AAD7HJX9_9AGAR|nr:hypothetical protein DFH07DRAFT_856963 [Mycena maculata]
MAIQKFIESRPAAFLHDNFRCIRFPAAFALREITEILSLCDGVVNVAVVTSATTILSLLESLPLQRLVVFWAEYFTTASCLNLTHLTHLGIRDWRDNALDPWYGLSLIPRLTHLSFYDLNAVVLATVGVLQRCQSLGLLVILCGNQFRFNWALDVRDTPVEKLVADPRFCMLVVHDHWHDDDWEVGARGGRCGHTCA